MTGQRNRSAGADLAVIWVAASLVVIAAAMGAYALGEASTAAFVRGLALPGSPAPDAATYDAASAGALGEAVIALVLGAAVAFFRARPVFLIAAIWSVLALGTGIWISFGTELRLASVQVGPVEVPVAVVGIGLALAAALCLAGSVAGWLASPGEPGPARPHMPPPTHQA